MPQPAASREGERAGGDLLAVAVRGHEDVGRREQIGEIVDREEPVVELDVVAEIELEYAPLEHQPVPLALAVGDVRMRAARDHVADLGVTRDHRRQRFDHRLEALPGRDQPERREQEAAACATIGRRCPKVGIAGGARVSRVGAPCGTTRIFSSGQAPHSTSSRSAVSVITITSSACAQSSVSTSAWCGVGSESTVCSVTTSGCARLLGERQHVLAVAAAEDPVFVLKEHDVDVEPAEHPGGADVVAADGLRDRREQAAPLRASRARSRPRRGRRARSRARRAASRAGRQRTCRSRKPAAGRWRRLRCACERRSASARARAQEGPAKRCGSCSPPRIDVSLAGSPLGCRSAAVRGLASGSSSSCRSLL